MLLMLRGHSNLAGTLYHCNYVEHGRKYKSMQKLSHSLSYNTNDADHKAWAIATVRMRVLKEYLAMAIPEWEYKVTYLETFALHTTSKILYTFTLRIDEESTL